jgi:hypothetical protein
MKKMLLSSLVAIASLTAVAAPQAEDTRVHARKVENASVAPGEKPGTISLQYTVVHSNPCVAGATHVGTTSIVNGHRLIVAVDAKWVKKVACPAVYRPTPVSYSTTLANLIPGEIYEVELLSQVSTVRVRAGR